MLMKLLLIAAVIAIIYFMFFKKKPAISDDAPKKDESSDMVECANCHVYSPIDDSIISNGKYYCSQECLKEAK